MEVKCTCLILHASFTLVKISPSLELKERSKLLKPSCILNWNYSFSCKLRHLYSSLDITSLLEFIEFLLASELENRNNRAHSATQCNENRIEMFMELKLQ